MLGKSTPSCTCQCGLLTLHSIDAPEHSLEAGSLCHCLINLWLYTINIWMELVMATWYTGMNLVLKKGHTLGNIRGLWLDSLRQHKVYISRYHRFFHATDMDLNEAQSNLGKRLHSARRQRKDPLLQFSTYPL